MIIFEIRSKMIDKIKNQKNIELIFHVKFTLFAF